MLERRSFPAKRPTACRTQREPNRGVRESPIPWLHPLRALAGPGAGESAADQLPTYISAEARLHRWGTGQRASAWRVAAFSSRYDAPKLCPEMFNFEHFAVCLLHSY
jgi:hypothetical protein